MCVLVTRGTGSFGRGLRLTDTIDPAVLLCATDVSVGNCDLRSELFAGRPEPRTKELLDASLWMDSWLMLESWLVLICYLLYTGGSFI